MCRRIRGLADKSGEWVASNGTNDKLSLDFLSLANRSRFMTARDCRRCEYRFAYRFRIPTTTFSRRGGGILCWGRPRNEVRHGWFHIGFWIKSPLGEKIKSLKSIFMKVIFAIGKYSLLLVIFSYGTCLNRLQTRNYDCYHLFSTLIIELKSKSCTQRINIESISLINFKKNICICRDYFL